MIHALPCRHLLTGRSARVIAGLMALVGTSVGIATAAAQQLDQARSLALFGEAGKVLQHPRCLNCHPAGDRPTQTDRMRPHLPMVVRGPDGRGAPGLSCNACHQAANYAESGVPGHPLWHQAPATMAWAGRSLGEICRQLKDPARNGGRDMASLLHHMSEDSLVGWAWAPGGKRTPAPGTQAEFGVVMHAWAETGAFCPPD
jgi:hypothetical protein